jgi:hypothetical protein
VVGVEVRDIGSLKKEIKLLIHFYSEVFSFPSF